MSIVGKITNGVVVLPPGTLLPEGTEVKVEAIELSPEEDSLVAAALKLAKPRDHLPPNYALNHGHYLRGEDRQ
jgi:hypothetical protein